MLRPSTGQKAAGPRCRSLACSLADDCAELFDADIHAWTQIHEFGGPLGAIAFDTRRADHLGSGAGTTLGVDMEAGSGAPYDDHHALDVQAEYSASMCGAATCPFYLANFVASNPSDSWDIWISWPFVVSELKQIHNVRIHALRSSMGAWRPSTGRVAFLPGAIVLDASFDMSSDCVGCSGLGDGHHEFSLINDSVVFGSFNDGALSLAHSFDVPGGTVMLDVQLEAYEHPPVAAIGFGSVIHCNDPSGYVLSVDDSAARDPDGDIDYEIWVVDGVAEGNGTIIPLGSHTLNLIAVDDRGAHDAAGERLVEVLPGPACL
jgi:hypothetical protein